MKMIEDAPEKVAYKLDVGDGRWLLTSMPASVAAETVRRASTYEESGDEGFELLVDGRMRFPKALFEAEAGDELRKPEAAKPKRRRAAKA